MQTELEKIKSVLAYRQSSLNTVSEEIHKEVQEEIAPSLSEGQRLEQETRSIKEDVQALKN